jgi:hypothetical protein
MNISQLDWLYGEPRVRFSLVLQYKNHLQWQSLTKQTFLSELKNNYKPVMKNNKIQATYRRNSF